MAGDIYLTQEGLTKMQDELQRLKSERPKISKAIGEARLLGDISENAEYDAAKEAQGQCEARIAALEDKIARARIIDHENIPKDKAFIGATVNLVDLDTEEEEVYTLVSLEEANYEEGKISIESPIGKALLGKKVNDVAEVNVPAGILKYRITKISR